MIWLIVFPLILVFLFREDIREKKKTVFIYIAFGLMLGMIPATIYGSIFASWRWSDYHYKTKFVSLRNGDGTSGSFVLGTGNIGSSVYYFYYVAVENGYQSRRLRDDGDVTVIEENRKDGELRRYVRERINPISMWWIVPQIIEDGDKYELRIPEGSLKKNFTIQ